MHLNRERRLTVTAPTPTSSADIADGTPTVTPGPATCAPDPLSSRPVVTVSLLTAHPGNVRHDLDLDAAFVASIAEAGILVPLRITPDDGSYRVIDGHRRLAAAIEAGMTEVPYELAEDRAGDEAAQFLDMYVVNHHRRDHKPLEEADALFAASQAGASRTRIRKITGLGKEQVTAALAAGKLSELVRGKAHVGYDLDLEQYALLAEFQDDPGAVEELLQAFRRNESGQHAAELIRTRRAAEAERERLVVQWREQGYLVSDSMPEGAIPVQFLLHEGQDLTPEAHADCNGRGIVFYPWDPTDPLHYCTDPSANGHQSRFATPPSPPSADHAPGGEEADESGEAAFEARPADGATEAPSRRLVVQGNRAWIAAAAVRRRWLDAMFARRTAPKEAPLFIAGQLLSMPGPLRNAMTRAPHLPMFGELTGHLSHDQLAAWAAARLPMIPLAMIVTAYEDQMGGESGKTTWRSDVYSACSTSEAGDYLRFLAATGYELSAIERAVVDGFTYTGDHPADDIFAADSAPAGDGESATGSKQPGDIAEPVDSGDAGARQEAP
jgi:ParB family chromosome partitioning protein